MQLKVLQTLQRLLLFHETSLYKMSCIMRLNDFKFDYIVDGVCKSTENNSDLSNVAKILLLRFLYPNFKINSNFMDFGTFNGIRRLIAIEEVPAVSTGDYGTIAYIKYVKPSSNKKYLVVNSIYDGPENPYWYIVFETEQVKPIFKDLLTQPETQLQKPLYDYLYSYDDNHYGYDQSALIFLMRETNVMQI